MSIAYLDISCRECDCNDIIVSYDENEQDIVCSCRECHTTGLLNDFDYSIEDEK